MHENLVQHYNSFVEPYITEFISSQLNETTSNLKHMKHILADLNQRTDINKSDNKTLTEDMTVS